MSRESPMSACPRCSAATAWPMSGDAVFCSACRRWFRRATVGFEFAGTGLPVYWRPLEGRREGQ